jgi:hypothetical protein
LIDGARRPLQPAPRAEHLSIRQALFIAKLLISLVSCSARTAWGNSRVTPSPKSPALDARLGCILQAAVVRLSGPMQPGQNPAHLTSYHMF